MGVNPTGDRTLRYSGSVEGLRWAGMDEAVASIAHQCDLLLVNLSRESAGLLRERSFFKVKGSERQVWSFIQSLGEALDQYNEEPAPSPPPVKTGWLARLLGR